MRVVVKCVGIRHMYSLRPTKSIVLEFKLCPTKSVVLACNEIHLIKVLPGTKKALHRKNKAPIKYLVDITLLVPIHMHSLRLRIQKTK